MVLSLGDFAGWCLGSKSWKDDGAIASCGQTSAMLSIFCNILDSQTPQKLICLQVSIQLWVSHPLVGKKNLGGGYSWHMCLRQEGGATLSKLEQKSRLMCTKTSSQAHPPRDLPKCHILFLVEILFHVHLNHFMLGEPRLPAGFVVWLQWWNNCIRQTWTAATVVIYIRVLLWGLCLQVYPWCPEKQMSTLKKKSLFAKIFHQSDSFETHTLIK